MRWLIHLIALIPAGNLQMPMFPMHPLTYASLQLPPSVGLAVPMEVPRPVQFAIPAYAPPTFCKTRPRPYNCPVCPPCLCSPCTPAFFSFCSPCHQKCRCRNINDVPVPLPLIPPAPIQGPAFPMPVPVADPLGILVPVHKEPSEGLG